MNIKSEKLLKLLSLIIFIIYMILIIWVVTFKCNLLTNITRTYAYYINQSLNERINAYLIPFKDYIEGPFISQIKTIIKDDILNVCIFIPLGIYLTFFFKKFRILKVLGITLFISICFELIQLFSLIGSFATKDVITNTFGAFLGYLICLVIYKRNNNSNIKILILNIISMVVIVCFLPIAIYAIFNTLINAKFYYEILTRTLVIPEIYR